jgi:lysine 6-dehydrogenase
MGYAVVFDLIRSPKVEKVALADVNEATLTKAIDRLADDRVVPCLLDITRTDEVVSLMADFDVVISCVTYSHNYELAKCALTAGVNFIDLGGSEEVVAKQFLLDDLAKERGVAIIPDTGLAPGLVSILAAAGAQSMDEIYEIRLRVGGLPVVPQPPLNYSLCFSVDGLLNEYSEEATVIRDGKLKRVPSLADLEHLHFPAPFHVMEAFNTAGGISTLPSTFLGKVQYLDYKTIRYKGHCEQIKVLSELGLLDNSEVQVNSTSVKPRELLKELIARKLPKNEPDVVLLRVTVTGVKQEKPVEIVWDAVDYGDEADGLSAMMRMTAFPASIVAQLIARGDIADKGVLAQEKCVPTPLFLAEMASRGINLVMAEKVPETHH